MDRTELTRRNNLATSKEWKEIRELLIEKVILLSKGSISPDKLQGMLMILSEPDSWISSFEGELKKVHKEGK